MISTSHAIVLTALLFWFVHPSEERIRSIPEGGNTFLGQSCAALQKGLIDTSKQGICIGTNRCPCIMVANIVTPNGDWINDYFWVIVDKTDSDSLVYHLTVYSRSGEMVFDQKQKGKSPSWDARHFKTGKEVPIADYFYVFDAGGKKSYGKVYVVR